MSRMSGMDSSGEQEVIRLSSRLPVRTKEVATALGISERTLRQQLFVAIKVSPHELGLSKAGELDRRGGP
jgi:hypothetical protein